MAAPITLRTVVARSGNLPTAAVLSGTHLYAVGLSVLGDDSVSGPEPAAASPGWRSKLRNAVVASPAARHVMRFKMRDGSRVRCRIIDSAGLLSVHVDRDYDVPNMSWAEMQTVVDIGAHVGSFTVWAALRAPRARCLAVEPNPETFELLVRNINDNGLTDRVTAVNAAVAGHTGTGTLEMLDHSLGTRLARGGNGAVSVRISTVERLLADAHMDRVDFMKMDCEGMEYEALGAIAPDQLSRIKVLACEYHPHPDHKLAELVALLSGAGLSVRHPETPLGILWATS